MDRPTIDWINTEPPNPGDKVLALTRYGVLILGTVTRYEWSSGHVVCWQHCPKKPENWDLLVVQAHQRPKNGTR